MLMLFILYESWRSRMNAIVGDSDWVATKRKELR